MSDSIIAVPAVNAAIVNEHREVLLTRRSPHIREPGKWCLPGGHVEVGEKWEVALKRELEEEIGIRIVSAELFGIYSDPTLTVTQEAVYEGKRGQFVVACFKVTQFEGEISLSSEVDDWDWFSLENLPDPIVRSHPIRVKDVFDFRGVPYVR